MHQEIKFAVDWLVELIKGRANLIAGHHLRLFLSPRILHLPATTHQRAVPRNSPNLDSDSDSEPDADQPTPILTIAQLSEFQRALTRILASRFAGNWFVAQPSRGQAFRCIRISAQFPVEQNLHEAALLAGIPYEALNIHQLDFALWIDPFVVAVKVGDCPVPLIIGQCHR